MFASIQQINRQFVAMKEANTFTETTAADFYAGAIFSTTNLDVKASMNYCFPQDDDLAQGIDNVFTAISRGEYDTLQDQINENYNAFITDYQLCQDWDDVVEAWQATVEFYTPFFQQDGIEQVMKDNFVKYQHEIEGYGLQAYMAWEGGAWWNAGALAGQLDKYLLAMPQLEEGNPGALPGNAARDFYSGVIYGWIGYDVKADMDTCFPDDEELGHMIEDNYAAWETKDWDTIVEVGTAASQRFAQDLGACADNVKVTAAIEALSEVVLNFQDQDDWEGVIQTNYENSQLYIDGYFKQSESAWFDSAKYYEAGNLGGLVDTYLFATTAF